MQNLYRLIYMLSSSQEEKVVDEFVQKVEAEVANLGGSVRQTVKGKGYMVKTSTNKGARGSYMLTMFFDLESLKIKQLDRYLKLAQGVVVNSIIMKLDSENEYQSLLRGDTANV